MRKKLAFILLLLMSAIAFAGDRVAPPLAESFPLAQSMPKGALVYIQSKDLALQLRTWYLSATHKRYFESNNYKEFTGSRLFLKFQERIQEFENITGFSLAEEDFAKAVGGKSALALYNIGDLEFVFATELPQAQLASSILAQKGDKLQTRKYANLTYYLKTTKSDFGETKTFAVALVGNKAIVATSETLMQRALKNNSDTKSEDQLVNTLVETVSQAEGFTGHDVTLWLDQALLNKDRYFRNYWIHKNLKSLEGLSKVLIDLELASDRFIERRWLFNSTITTLDKETNFSQLLSYVPTSTQLININQANADNTDLNQALETVILGPKREVAALETGYNPASSELGFDYNNEELANNPYKRYLSLDQRFDQDIDSQELKAEVVKANESKFFANLNSILSSAQPLKFAVIAESAIDTTSSFVSFNRAVIVEFAQGEKLTGSQLEKVISDELKERFVINGSPIKFNWQTSPDSSRSLSRVLIEHGGAYLLQKNVLIVASSADYLNKLTSNNTISDTTLLVNNTKLTRFAMVKVSSSKTSFDKLMRRLDGLGLSDATPKPTANPDTESEESETSSNNLLFSQNISSLIGVAKDINFVTLEQTTSSGVIKEQINYKFSQQK
ncbi:MAG: hypothetical protein HY819_22360 [Acidobacteria bacterium]|nr:hypothetical protein [Acidobacteriota bacterium]